MHKNRTKAIHPMARPLNDRLNAGTLTRKFIAQELEIESAAITNWLARGVSAEQLPKLARLCGVSVEEYLDEAGMLTDADIEPDEIKRRRQIEQEVIKIIRLYPSKREQVLAFCRGMQTHEPAAAPKLPITRHTVTAR